MCADICSAICRRVDTDMLPVGTSLSGQCATPPPACGVNPLRRSKTNSTRRHIPIVVSPSQCLLRKPLCSRASVRQGPHAPDARMCSSYGTLPCRVAAREDFPDPDVGDLGAPRFLCTTSSGNTNPLPQWATRAAHVRDSATPPVVIRSSKLFRRNTSSYRLRQASMLLASVEVPGSVRLRPLALRGVRFVRSGVLTACPRL